MKSYETNCEWCEQEYCVLAWGADGETCCAECSRELNDEPHERDYSADDWLEKHGERKKGME